MFVFELVNIMLNAPVTIFCKRPSVVVSILSSSSLSSSDLFSSHQDMMRGTLDSSRGQSDCSSSASLLVKHESISLSLRFRLLLLLRCVLEKRQRRARFHRVPVRTGSLRRWKPCHNREGTYFARENPREWLASASVCLHSSSC